MAKFRVRLRVRGYISVDVDGKDEDDAMMNAEKMINDDIERYVGDADSIEAEVSDCDEIK